MKNFISLLFVGGLLGVLLGGISSVQAAPAPTCPTGSTCLENPLQNNTTDAATIIGTVIKAALSVIGAITLFMFVQGASTWLLSAGNAEKVSAGAKTMLWAGIGVLLVFASYIVVSGLIKLMTG